MVQLVAGRECGGCTVCCQVPPIDTPEFQKQAGVLCRHCTGAGCAIHAARPPVCQDYFCGWRQLDDLDDSWRPDRCGVMVVPELGDIPPGYRPGAALKFVVTGRFEVAFRPDFVRYLVSAIDAGVPMFLALPGPPGHFAARIFLNERLRPAAVARDGQGLIDGLAGALKILMAGRFEPVVLRDQPGAAQG